MVSGVKTTVVFDHRHEKIQGRRMENFHRTNEIVTVNVGLHIENRLICLGFHSIASLFKILRGLKKKKLVDSLIVRLNISEFLYERILLVYYVHSWPIYYKLPVIQA